MDKDGWDVTRVSVVGVEVEARPRRPPPSRINLPRSGLDLDQDRPGLRVASNSEVTQKETLKSDSSVGLGEDGRRGHSVRTTYLHARVRCACAEGNGRTWRTRCSSDVDILVYSFSVHVAALLIGDDIAGPWMLRVYCEEKLSSR